MVLAATIFGRTRRTPSPARGQLSGRARRRYGQIVVRLGIFRSSFGSTNAGSINRIGVSRS
jgi:hypothetical protein